MLPQDLMQIVAPKLSACLSSALTIEAPSTIEMLYLSSMLHSAVLASDFRT
jgi:hypothetical protein